MFRNNYFLKSAVLLLYFLSGVNIVFAYEGHHDSIVSIERSTFVHLQSILSAYKEVYGHLVKKETVGITDFAQKMMDAASQGALTEPDGFGRHIDTAHT